MQLVSHSSGPKSFLLCTVVEIRADFTRAVVGRWRGNQSMGSHPCLSTTFWHAALWCCYKEQKTCMCTVTKKSPHTSSFHG